jgi:hypothetical protein
VGLSATPGAFIAKRLTRTSILDAAIICGGVVLITQGLRQPPML